MALPANNQANHQEVVLKDLARLQGHRSLRLHAQLQEVQQLQEAHRVQEVQPPQAHAHQMETETANAKPRTSAPLAPPDQLEKQDLMVFQVFPELTVSQEKAPKISTMNQQRDVSTARQDPKAHPDLRANPVSVECVDLKDLQDSQAETETQAHRANKEALDPLEMMASQDNQETRELTQRSQSAEREAVDLQVHKEKKAQSETREPMVALERPAHQDPQELQVSQEELVPMAMKDLRELSEDQVPTQNTVPAPLAVNRTEVEAPAQVEADQVALAALVLMLVVARPVDIVAVSSKL